MKLIRYTLPFPAYLAPVWVLIYFNCFGFAATGRFHVSLLETSATLAGLTLALLLLYYRPSLRSNSDDSKKGAVPFAYAGQGYIEAIAILSFGWFANWTHWPAWVKLVLFFLAVSIIDLCLETLANRGVQEPSQYL